MYQSLTTNIAYKCMKTSGFKGHRLTLKKIQCCQYPLFLFFPVKLKQQWVKVVINMQNNVTLNVF